MQNLSDIGNYWENNVMKSPGFETFTIPKNFVVYHGGGAMKANVEFPIGKEYYSPITPRDPRSLTNAQRTILKNNTIPENMEKTYAYDIVSKYSEHAFFGTYETAKTYSDT